MHFPGTLWKSLIANSFTLGLKHKFLGNSRLLSLWWRSWVSVFGIWTYTLSVPAFTSLLLPWPNQLDPPTRLTSRSACSQNTWLPWGWTVVTCYLNHCESNFSEAEYWHFICLTPYTLHLQQITNTVCMSELRMTTDSVLWQMWWTDFCKQTFVP